MNSGSFFRLDLEVSKVEEGITIFDYIDLPIFDSNKDGVSYPIRITITSDEVLFFVHYFQEKEALRHSEDVLLCLPYGRNCEEDLSSVIKRIYNTAFPLSPFLNKLLHRRYIKKNDKQYGKLRNSQINKDAYSSLYIWDLVEKQSNGTYAYQIQDNQYQQEDNDQPRITKFLRKLLLDFMYDMMHSDVFASSKYYTEMKDGLMNDFFFSAIVKKSEYYYYRRIIRNKLQSVVKNEEELSSLSECIALLRFEEIKKNKQLSREQRKRYCNPRTINVINEAHNSRIESFLNTKHDYRIAFDTIKLIKDLYAEKLDESEAEWINVITSQKADHHFSFKPEWYEDQRPRKKRRGFNVSDSWFVNPEEEMARIQFPLKEDPEFRNKGQKLYVHYINSYELGELFGTGDNISILERNTNVSKWFYRRFDFVDTYRIHLFKYFNDAFALLLLIFALVVIVPCLFPDFWLCPRNIALFPAVVAVGFLITSGILFFKRCRVKIERVDDLFVRNRFKRDSFKSLSLSVLFGAVWAFLYCHNVPDSNCWLFFAGKVAALVLMVLLSLYIIPPKAHIINNIHLFLPRLVASITAAWIMIVIGNDLVKEYLSWPIWVILSIVVFSFILYEGNKSLPNITTGHRVWRALELMLISFSISLIIGIFAVNILSPSLVQDAKEYGIVLGPYSWSFLKGYNDLAINIFPEYLVPFSFLAMFIGVFIQMIFEEKNVTEL